LRKTACVGVGYCVGTLADEKKGGVVDVCGDVAISRDELGNFVGDAEDAVIFCCDA
jgi:hypothetical protein